MNSAMKSTEMVLLYEALRAEREHDVRLAAVPVLERSRHPLMFFNFIVEIPAGLKRIKALLCTYILELICLLGRKFRDAKSLDCKRARLLRL